MEPEAVPFAETILRTRKARLEAGIDGRDWREVPFGEAVTLGAQEIGKGKPGPGEDRKQVVILPVLQTVAAPTSSPGLIAMGTTN